MGGPGAVIQELKPLVEERFKQFGKLNCQMRA
jgi:hypothetical protein